MRRNLFKEAIPAERDRRSAGRKYQEASVLDMIQVARDDNGAATTKLISFLKKEKFAEFKGYFRKNIDLFGERYDIYVPYAFKKGEFTVDKWFIEPSHYNSERWLELYDADTDIKYLDPSFKKIVKGYGLDRMRAYLDDNVYYGVGINISPLSSTITPINFVNKLLVVYEKLKKVNDSYSETSEMSTEEYYTYKGKLPDNKIQINAFYVDGENGRTVVYDCAVVSVDKCYINSEESSTILDLDDPSVTVPFFRALAVEEVIEDEDVHELAEEFENDGDYNYLQIFDVSDWPEYFELVGKFLKSKGLISEYNIEVNRNVNPRRKARIKNNPSLRQKYESRISKISKRMREAEEDWDDLGYNEDDAGVEDYDDPSEVLDGEDYFTYDDPDYIGMNDGERAYDHYDSDMEDVIADSMPTRRKGLGIGKKRGDSSYFDKDYLEAPDMWDENGDVAPEVITESKRPFKTRLY